MHRWTRSLWAALNCQWMGTGAVQHRKQARKTDCCLGCTKSLPCEELEQVWGGFFCLFVLIHEQFSTKNTFCILMAEYRFVCLFAHLIGYVG